MPLVTDYHIPVVETAVVTTLEAALALIEALHASALVLALLQGLIITGNGVVTIQRLGRLRLDVRLISIRLLYIRIRIVKQGPLRLLAAGCQQQQRSEGNP